MPGATATAPVDGATETPLDPVVLSGWCRGGVPSSVVLELDAGRCRAVGEQVVDVGPWSPVEVAVVPSLPWWQWRWSRRSACSTSDVGWTSECSTSARSTSCSARAALDQRPGCPRPPGWTVDDRAVARRQAVERPRAGLVDVRGARCAVDAAAVRRQEADGRRRRHHHAHRRGQLLDPLVVAQRRDARRAASRSALESVELRSSERPMLAPSFRTSTCIATIPASITPSSGIHTRPRISRSSSAMIGQRPDERAASRRRAASGARRGGRRGAGDARAAAARAARRRRGGARGRGRAADAAGRRGRRAVGRATPPRSGMLGRCLTCGGVALAGSCAASFELARGAQVRRLRSGVGRDLPGVGATARRVSSSASGSWPQTQIGISGGQMQPRARSARNRLTRRSSSEWNEIAAKRPSARSSVPGERQRVVELGELVVDGDPQRLERAPGRVAAGELGRHRDRRLDHLDELLGGAQLAARRRARAIARAICEA